MFWGVDRPNVIGLVSGGIPFATDAKHVFWSGNALGREAREMMAGTTTKLDARRPVEARADDAPIGRVPKVESSRRLSYLASGMAILAPTPLERLVDSRNRPVFLWDSDMDLPTFRQRLVDADVDVRAYYIGKLMRQAKPDDVFSFVTAATIRAHWDRILPYLGKRRAMWEWLFGEWAKSAEAAREE